jgi:uncharacterized integral membrane protein
MAAQQFYYSSSLELSAASSYWSALTINLLVAIVAAVLCFIFIGINVSSLKLRYDPSIPSFLHKYAISQWSLIYLCYAI